MKQVARLVAEIAFKGIPGVEKYSVIFDDSDELTFEEIQAIAYEQRVMVDKSFKNKVNGSLILDNTLINVEEIRSFKVTVTNLEGAHND